LGHATGGQYHACIDADAVRSPAIVNHSADDLSCPIAGIFCEELGGQGVSPHFTLALEQVVIHARSQCITHDQTRSAVKTRHVKSPPNPQLESSSYCHHGLFRLL